MKNIEGRTNMTTFRCMALLFLGIAFCTGCGDSSTQPWEGKSQPSGEKKGPKIEGTAHNDQEGPAGEPADPHGMFDPHGAMNPHDGMQMPAGGSDAKLENTGKLDIETVHFTVPKSWIRKAPNPMLLAEFALPRAEGDKQDGRLTVSQAGGTLKDNINRWKGQFADEPEKENRETIDAGGVKVTLVDFSGAFDDTRGMSGPDYRLLGAIFQLPNKKGLCFIKCYGPQKTITARAEEIKGFIRSLKVDK
jgi:hypothetical protein